MCFPEKHIFVFINLTIIQSDFCREETIEVITLTTRIISVKLHGDHRIFDIVTNGDIEGIATAIDSI